jgi:hypothetical protein
MRSTCRLFQLLLQDLDQLIRRHSVALLLVSITIAQIINKFLYSFRIFASHLSMVNDVADRAKCFGVGNVSILSSTNLLHT